MDFEASDKVRRLEGQVRHFVEREVYRAEAVFERQLAEAADRWQIPPIMEELKAKAKGSVLLSEDPGYDDARRIWNGMIDRRPGVIVQCAGADDVARAIAFARENEAEISGRG